LNQENYSEIFEKVHPTASQWKDGGTRNDDIFVTVGEGTHVMCRQGIVEIAFVNKKLNILLENDTPKIIDLFNLLFGPRSRVGCLLEEKLEISSEKLSEQLGLFSLS
jgi:TPP-dependent trihydroxycyclohexane-1,2-dione (THcHDO) dehydratase